MEIFIGIDGGGTKTEAAAINGTGQVVSRYTGGSTNPYIVSFDGAMKELQSVLEGLLARMSPSLGVYRAICLGMSGVSSAEERERVRKFVHSYFEGHRLLLSIFMRSEAEISLMAALEHTHGLLVISGTGSNTYGMTASGDIHRVGGWGHLLGDEGSGYQIGLLTLKSVIKSQERILPPTRMSDFILKAYPLDQIADIKSYIYQPGITKQHIASFARCCIEAAEAGDEAALAILRGQAAELAETTCALIRQRPEFESSDVVCVGSIFTHSRLFREWYRETMLGRYPQLKFPEVKADRTPAQGAAMLACRLFTEGVR